uniref:RRM domain-containing protein n=1 Tax=Oryza barthii TaxID=65489 RepID=A0A0D3GSV0_9ORYZ
MLLCYHALMRVQRPSHPRGSQRDFFGHNQRQSHPHGSQRDFFGQSTEFTIYITITKNILTWKNIRDYFKKFGPVINVYIPFKPDNEKHTFGFVTFENDDTVGLLLSKSTSHSISGVELPQRNDRFDNVAHRTSCANAIEGHSGQKMPNFIELSQETLTHRFGDFDSPLTHNLSEKKTESPEGSAVFQMTYLVRNSEGEAALV